jgi:hypothetical protein
LKSLAELLALVKQLREDVRGQSTQIQYLHQLIENCAGCKQPAESLRENCDYANPCFPGNLILMTLTVSWLLITRLFSQVYNATILNREFVVDTAHVVMLAMEKHANRDILVKIVHVFREYSFLCI